MLMLMLREWPFLLFIVLVFSFIGACWYGDYKRWNALTKREKLEYKCNARYERDMI